MKMDFVKTFSSTRFLKSAKEIFTTFEARIPYDKV